MFKFFRLIRQKLIHEPKLGRYLLYALGEIILVVIGILIAVSINDWNDERKDRIEEKELYQTLIRSLDNDLVDVRSKILIIDSALYGQEIFIKQSYEEIKANYSAEEFYDLIFKVSITSRSFVPNISLYTKITQNKQIDLIQSKELQMKIIELYEVHYWEYKDLDSSLETQAITGMISNFFGDVAHILQSPKENWSYEIMEEHYPQLKNDCQRIFYLTRATRNSMLNCEERIQTVLEAIRSELGE